METGHKGFKLFELVLIAAVFGSVGVTVIPQFTQAGSEDNIIQMMGALHHVRSQIDLYRAQHKGMLPTAFETAMTQKDAAGFGPYMQSLPVNPFNRLNTVRVNGDPGSGAGMHGWHYNSATGDFYADDSKCHSQL
ncbi:MAG: hypothetical protein Q7T18_07395 [Sedimentisphaerales bacterium]|nr:hypothetical protein [Sedimentisphaerales bacterium]